MTSDSMMKSEQPKTNIHAQGVNLKLAQWSFKEIKSGQLWPVSIAITLIIACVFALSALAERMEQVIVKQGKDALTADLVFVSSNPPPVSLNQLIEEAQLESSQYVSYATMAFSDLEMQLVTVKAVESNYPLRGEFVLAGEGSVSNEIKPGELWLESRVFSQLNVKVGDSVTIGDADFVVSGTIAEEPGLNFNPFQQMPTVMIHYVDIEKTGAVQLGSRVRYQTYLNGSTNELEDLKQKLELTPSDRWRDKGNGGRTNEIFDTTTQYLSLTVAIVIIMAATTLVLTCQHYVAGRRKTIAMLKSIGASKKWIGRWLTIQVSLLVIIGAFFGIAIGIGLEVLLRYPLTDLLPDPLPNYGLMPFIIALATCLLIGVPALGIPMISLLNTSAINVLQPDNQHKSKTSLWLIAVPVIPMLVAYGDNQLVWIILVAIAAMFIVLGALSIMLTRLLGLLPWSPAMVLAISRLNRSSVASGLQFGALSLSLMLLAVIWLVRTDLLQNWEQTIPEDAPNAFALNIASYELNDYLDVLDTSGIERSNAYPIIRGRLTEIDGVDAKEAAQKNPQGDATRRELNLTWAESLPVHNQVLDGEWGAPGSVSIESSVADDLDVEIGDVLTFVINAQTVNATVNSIRQVEWREMKPNFYFIFSPDLVESLSAAYLVSYRIEDQHSDTIKQLSNNHPTVSLMDVRKMGEKIQSLLEQIVWSITVLASLGVIAGLMLIFTLLRLSLSQRQLEIRLYRTLGASRKRISNTIWSEYGLMAVIAGIVASIGAELSVASIMKFGFELSPSPHFGLWIALPIITFVILALVVSSLINQLLQPVKNGSL